MRLASFLAVIITLSVAPALPAQEEDRSRLTVTGTGEAAAAPDMATISLGVTERAATAAEAMDATSEAVSSILGSLEGFEITGRDVQTSGLRLNPVYEDRRNEQGPAEIVAYEAANEVSIRVRRLDDLGEILGAVLSDGANTLGDLSFSVAEPEPLLDEARRAAVADARRKAELFASAAGVTLGPIIEMNEAGGGRPVPMPMAEMRMSVADVPIAGGETGYSAQVSIVYELVQ